MSSEETLDLEESLVVEESLGESYFCPFCAGRHSLSTRECREIGHPVPSAYIDAQRRQVPTVPMLTIGYASHGKTCFLSGLMHYLYHGPPAETWENFTFFGLTQETLNMVHDEFVTVLDRGDLPPNTASVFPEPLIMQFDNFPLARKLFKWKQYAPKELITVFYDIGGEVYNSDETIKNNLPIVQVIKHLIFLIDLSLLVQESEAGGASVVQQLHNLLNTVFNAISDLGANGKKGILICFTKADRLWGKEGFGPLSERAMTDLPPFSAVGAYSKNMDQRSKEIGDFIRRKYPLFYNSLATHFKPVQFTAVSALGANPENNRIGVLRPANVMDPLFWCLKMEDRL